MNERLSEDAVVAAAAAAAVGRLWTGQRKGAKNGEDWTGARVGGFRRAAAARASDGQ